MSASEKRAARAAARATAKAVHAETVAAMSPEELAEYQQREAEATAMIVNNSTRSGLKDRADAGDSTAARLRAELSQMRGDGIAETAIRAHLDAQISALYPSASADPMAPRVRGQRAEGSGYVHDVAANRAILQRLHFGAGNLALAQQMAAARGRRIGMGSTLISPMGMAPPHTK